VARLSGQLLVASPVLVDPSFRRSVVLVIAHDDEGAVGLVLNHPSAAEVAEAVPPLEPLVDPGDLVAVGGPVQPEAVCVLAEWDDPAVAGTIVFEDVGLMAGDATLEHVLPATRRRRVFAGYARWGAGQLESELEEPSWIVADARVEDVFGEARDLWAEVLRRKGGPYTLLATMPEDPSLN
jgi:putative transcriptional regulator